MILKKQLIFVTTIKNQLNLHCTMRILLNKPNGKKKIIQRRQFLLIKLLQALIIIFLSIFIHPLFIKKQVSCDTCASVEYGVLEKTIKLIESGQLLRHITLAKAETS